FQHIRRRAHACEMDHKHRRFFTIDAVVEVGGWPVDKFHPLTSLAKVATRASKCAAPFAAISMVWAWLSCSSDSPAPILVIIEQPTTFSPQCLAIIQSGTLDMPTASAPMVCAMRISAGLSNVGPRKAI